MEDHIPFAKIEQNVRRAYRNNLNIAESTEDVKKFFWYALKDFFTQSFGGRVRVDIDDVVLERKVPGGFIMSTSLRRHPEVRSLWKSSGLQRIVARLAENALNHIQHLEENHPDKSEAKPFPSSFHAGRHYNSPPPAGRGGR